MMKTRGNNKHKLKWKAKRRVYKICKKLFPPRTFFCVWNILTLLRHRIVIRLSLLVPLFFFNVFFLYSNLFCWSFININYIRLMFGRLKQFYATQHNFVSPQVYFFVLIEYSASELSFNCDNDPLESSLWKRKLHKKFFTAVYPNILKQKAQQNQRTALIQLQI